MEIEQSSLYPQIQAIWQNPKPVSFKWSAIVHVNQRGLDVPALHVIQIDVTSDYESAYSDEITVELLLTGGVYANQIYPFQDDLDITLIKQPIGETSSAVIDSAQTLVMRYQATLIDEGNPQIEGNGRTVMSQRVLDLTTLSRVKFQLMDKSLFQIRMMTFGTVFRQNKVDDIIKTVLTQASQAVDLDDNLKVLGVNMVPPNNQKVIEQIPIPHAGLPVVDVPNFIQQSGGGVYSAGFSCYLKNRYWHVFPSYDTTRTTQAERHATVIIVPTNKYPGIERTYRLLSDTSMMILATGEVKFRGDSTVQQLALGNGVRFSDASKFMDQAVVAQGNIAVASRGNINNEFMAVARPNGYNHVTLAPQSITANPFEQSSRLARRNGSVISVVWQNSNDALIKPGMMFTLYWLENDTIRQLEGVLLKSFTFVRMASPGITNDRHISETQLSIFVQNPLN